MEKISHFFEVIIDFVTRTYNFVAPIIYGVFVWLGMDVDMIKFLTWFMIGDSILGAIKYVRLGHKFSFGKLLWGFCIKLIWLLIPMSVALLGKALKIGNFTPAVMIVIRILTANEFLSCITNMYCIKNKAEIKNVDFVSSLLKALRVATENFIKTKLSIITKSGSCKLEDDDETSSN